jgi:hypothetical protein
MLLVESSSTPSHVSWRYQHLAAERLWRQEVAESSSFYRTTKILLDKDQMLLKLLPVPAVSVLPAARE